MKEDLETMLDKILTTLKEKINPKLLAIDSEKNDGIVLAPVDGLAYMFQSLDDTVTNFDPSIYYGIEACPTEAIHGAIEKTLRVEITFILADNQDKSIHKRLMRYQRCLEEIFTDEVFPILGTREKVKLTSLEPITFKTQNATTESKAVGVIIELELFS